MVLGVTGNAVMLQQIIYLCTRTSNSPLVSQCVWNIHFKIYSKEQKHPLKICLPGDSDNQFFTDVMRDSLKLHVSTTSSFPVQHPCFETTQLTLTYNKHLTNFFCIYHLPSSKKKKFSDSMFFGQFFLLSWTFWQSAWQNTPYVWL